jgi:hypothetical protein
MREKPTNATIMREKKYALITSFPGKSVRLKTCESSYHISQNRLMENHDSILVNFVTRSDSKTGVNMNAMFLARPFLKM